MKYGTDVDNAIREACARRERPSQVLVRLRAGTLPGLDRPVPEIADRTFWGKWSRARREQKQGTPEDDGWSLLDKIAAHMMRDCGASPEEIAKRVGAGHEEVQAWFAEFDQRDREQQRPDPFAEHVERIKRGKAMIAAGSSLEEAAEAIGMPLYEAREYLRSALAEQAERGRETTTAGSRNGARLGA